MVALDLAAGRLVRPFGVSLCRVLVTIEWPRYRHGFSSVQRLGRAQLRLVEFYGGYRPRAFVASNGNSQAVKFVQPQILDCAGDPIGQDDGLADELS